jgi:hypothetical protein
MGDIWLSGLPPKYTDWKHCFAELGALMPSRADAIILAAIAGPESSYDMSVINDTPATGDYSVGLWQINYYGSLHAGRVAEFGTPRQLIEGGLRAQARAAHKIWSEQGFNAWYNTYSSGDWRKYVGTGGGPPLGGPGGNVPPQPPPADTADDWSGHVRRSAGQFLHIGHTLHRHTQVLDAVRYGKG